MHMMNKYYFINKFDTNIIDKQDKHTTIIYRNYNSKTIDQDLILKIKKYCKKSKFKLIRKLIELLKMNKLLLKDKTPILSQTDLVEGFALKGFLVKYQISKF